MGNLWIRILINLKLIIDRLFAEFIVITIIVIIIVIVKLVKVNLIELLLSSSSFLVTGFLSSLVLLPLSQW
jgi:hypothetical protein